MKRSLYLLLGIIIGISCVTQSSFAKGSVVSSHEEAKEVHTLANILYNSLVKEVPKSVFQKARVFIVPINLDNETKKERLFDSLFTEALEAEFMKNDISISPYSFKDAILIEDERIAKKNHDEKLLRDKSKMEQVPKVASLLRVAKEKEILASSQYSKAKKREYFLEASLEQAKEVKITAENSKKEIEKKKILAVEKEKKVKGYLEQAKIAVKTAHTAENKALESVDNSKRKERNFIAQYPLYTKTFAGTTQAMNHNPSSVPTQTVANTASGNVVPSNTTQAMNHNPSSVPTQTVTNTASGNVAPSNTTQAMNHNPSSAVIEENTKKEIPLTKEEKLKQEKIALEHAQIQAEVTAKEAEYKAKKDAVIVAKDAVKLQEIALQELQNTVKKIDNTLLISSKSVEQSKKNIEKLASALLQATNATEEAQRIHAECKDSVEDMKNIILDITTEEKALSKQDILEIIISYHHINGVLTITAQVESLRNNTLKKKIAYSSNINQYTNTILSHGVIELKNIRVRSVSTAGEGEIDIEKMLLNERGIH